MADPTYIEMLNEQREINSRVRPLVRTNAWRDEQIKKLLGANPSLIEGSDWDVAGFDLDGNMTAKRFTPQMWSDISDFPEEGSYAAVWQPLGEERILNFMPASLMPIGGSIAIRDDDGVMKSGIAADPEPEDCVTHAQYQLLVDRLDLLEAAIL